MTRKPSNVSQEDWDSLDVPEIDFSKRLSSEQLPKVIRDHLGDIRNKQRITIRLDSDIVAFFKAQVEKDGHGSYQSLMNSALRDHIDGKVMSIILREAVHDAVVEELKAV